MAEPISDRVPRVGDWVAVCGDKGKLSTVEYINRKNQRLAAASRGPQPLVKTPSGSIDVSLQGVEWRRPWPREKYGIPWNHGFREHTEGQYALRRADHEKARRVRASDVESPKSLLVCGDVKSNPGPTARELLGRHRTLIEETTNELAQLRRCSRRLTPQQWDCVQRECAQDWSEEALSRGAPTPLLGDCNTVISWACDAIIVRLSLGEEFWPAFNAGVMDVHDRTTEEFLANRRDEGNARRESAIDVLLLALPWHPTVKESRAPWLRQKICLAVWRCTHNARALSEAERISRGVPCALWYPDLTIHGDVEPNPGPKYDKCDIAFGLIDDHRDFIEQAIVQHHAVVLAAAVEMCTAASYRFGRDGVKWDPALFKALLVNERTHNRTVKAATQWLESVMFLQRRALKSRNWVDIYCATDQEIMNCWVRDLTNDGDVESNPGPECPICRVADTNHETDCCQNLLCQNCAIRLNFPGNRGCPYCRNVPFGVRQRPSRARYVAGSQYHYQVGPVYVNRRVRAVGYRVQFAVHARLYEQRVVTIRTNALGGINQRSAKSINHAQRAFPDAVLFGVELAIVPNVNNAAFGRVKIPDASAYCMHHRNVWFTRHRYSYDEENVHWRVNNPHPDIAYFGEWKVIGPGYNIPITHYPFPSNFGKLKVARGFAQWDHIWVKNRVLNGLTYRFNSTKKPLSEYQSYLFVERVLEEFNFLEVNRKLTRILVPHVHGALLARMYWRKSERHLHANPWHMRLLVAMHEAGPVSTIRIGLKIAAVGLAFIKTGFAMNAMRAGLQRVREFGCETSPPVAWLWWRHWFTLQYPWPVWMGWRHGFHLRRCFRRFSWPQRETDVVLAPIPMLDWRHPMHGMASWWQNQYAILRDLGLHVFLRCARKADRGARACARGFVAVVDFYSAKVWQMVAIVSFVGILYILVRYRRQNVRLPEWPAVDNRLVMSRIPPVNGDVDRVNSSVYTGNPNATVLDVEERVNIADRITRLWRPTSFFQFGWGPPNDPAYVDELPHSATNSDMICRVLAQRITSPLENPETQDLAVIAEQKGIEVLFESVSPTLPAGEMLEFSEYLPPSKETDPVVELRVSSRHSVQAHVNPRLWAYIQSLIPRKKLVYEQALAAMIKAGTVNEQPAYERIRATAFVKYEYTPSKKVKPRMIQYLKPHYMMWYAPMAQALYGRIFAITKTTDKWLCTTAGLDQRAMSEIIVENFKKINANNNEPNCLDESIRVHVNGDDNIAFRHRKFSKPLDQRPARWAGRDPEATTWSSLRDAAYCSGGFWLVCDNGVRTLHYMLNPARALYKAGVCRLDALTAQKACKSRLADSSFGGFVHAKALSLIDNFHTCPFIRPIAEAVLAVYPADSHTARAIEEIREESMYKHAAPATQYQYTPANSELKWLDYERRYGYNRSAWKALSTAIIRAVQSRRIFDLLRDPIAACWRHALRVEMGVEPMSTVGPYGDEWDGCVDELDFGSFDRSTQSRAHKHQVKMHSVWARDPTVDKQPFVQAIKKRRRIVVTGRGPTAKAKWVSRYAMLSGYHDTSASNGLASNAFVYYWCFIRTHPEAPRTNDHSLSEFG